MTKEEAIKKLIESSDLVAWIKGVPHFVDEVALTLDQKDDDWTGWQFITILHNLNGKQALEVFNAIKEDKNLLIDPGTPTPQKLDVTNIFKQPAPVEEKSVIEIAN
jgi:hypothetical protein